MADQKNIRTTRQQRVVLETLCKTTSHPTADDLFLAVRKVLPRVSLATVYRNLAKLEGMGEIQVLESKCGQRRFDGNSVLHLHFRCRACHDLYDVPMKGTSKDILEKVGTLFETAFEVEDCKCELIGICDKCR